MNASVPAVAPFTPPETAASSWANPPSVACVWIVRDLRVHRILEGTNEIMRVVIGRAEAARARASA